MAVSHYDDSSTSRENKAKLDIYLDSGVAGKGGGTWRRELSERVDYHKCTCPLSDSLLTNHNRNQRNALLKELSSTNNNRNEREAATTLITKGRRKPA